MTLAPSVIMLAMIAAARAYRLDAATHQRIVQELSNA
jgi:Na+/melibiose symporter-like transporter